MRIYFCPSQLWSRSSWRDDGKIAYSSSILAELTEDSAFLVVSKVLAWKLLLRQGCRIFGFEPFCQKLWVQLPQVTHLKFHQFYFGGKALGVEVISKAGSSASNLEQVFWSWSPSYLINELTMIIRQRHKRPTFDNPWLDAKSLSYMAAPVWYRT